MNAFSNQLNTLLQQTSSSRIEVYHKFPEKKPIVTVTTPEVLDTQETLTDLKKTMEEFGADIEAAKAEEKLAK